MGGLLGLSSSADNDNSGIATEAKSEYAFFRSRTVGGVRGDSGLKSRPVGEKDLKKEITTSLVRKLVTQGTCKVRRESKRDEKRNEVTLQLSQQQ